jgi:spore germination cell wall hydrolase CwlJ-like protein
MKLLKVTLALAIVAFPTIAQTNNKVKHLTDLQCLTANLFFEARGEKPVGKVAVADVTKNRVQSKKYPGNLCSVVFQRKQFSWTHQQSWNSIQRVLNGSVSGFRSADRAAYYRAKEIAEKSLKGLVRVLPESSLHYHATYVKPSWSRKMKVYAKIGTHVFYNS